MPIRQRCLACRRVYDLDKKICSCGARLTRHVFLVTDIGGRRYTRTLGRCTRTYAEEIYVKWKAELLHPTTAPPPSLKEICDNHIHRMKAEGHTYWRKVELFFQRAVNFFGDVPAHSITPVMAQQFKTLLDSGSLSPAYVDRHVSELKAAWNTSLDLPNPFRRVKLNRPDNTTIERLTPEEERKLLATAKRGIPKAPRYLYEIVLVAIHTGLRRGDILNLHSSQVDFQEHLITVRIMKTNKTHRIPMNKTLRDALLAIRPKDEGYYFLSHRVTDRPYNDFEGAWKTLKKAAGITRPFRFHGLRHHFATKLLRETGNLALVSKLLDHSSTAVTEKYAHVLMSDMREAVKKLDMYPDMYPNS